MTSRVLVVSAVALGLVACAKQSDPSLATVANVAGQSISQGLVDYYVAQKTGVTADKVDPALKASLIKELEQLTAAAVAEEPKVTADTREALELQRIELLAHAGAIAAGVFAPPSDKDLRAEYDGYVASLPAEQFHVAHILVATESMAQALIVKLQAGADFARLAQEQSADDSKSKGGDLGWITPGKLPVALTDAAKALKAGQVTARPVQTIYGWHVIKLLESRPSAAPPFEQVKAQLASNLQQQRYKQFLASAATK